MSRTKRHDIDLVIDRLLLKENIQSRLTDSIETAFKYANGLVCILNEKKEHFFSSRLQCMKCNIVIRELAPRLFSFNSPEGACENMSWFRRDDGI